MGLTPVIIVTPKINKNESFAKRSQIEIQVYQQIKHKNQMIKQQKSSQRQEDKPQVRTLSVPSSASGNKGYTNVILLPLIASFVCGALLMIVYMLIKG